MPIASSIASDFEIFDDQQVVAVNERNGLWSANVNAVVRAIRNFEVDRSEGAYRAGDVRVHFKAGDFAIAPKVGDFIQVGGSDFVVIEGPTVATLGTRLQVACRSIEIEGSEAVEFSVERLSGRRDAAGAEVIEYVPTGVVGPGRLQPIDTGENQIRDGAVGPAREFAFHTTTALTLNPRDVIRVGTRRFAWRSLASEQDIRSAFRLRLTEVHL